MRTPGGIVFLMVVLGLAGCSGSSPSGPAPGSQPPPGAFFIRGTVFDTAFRPLAGTRVEVVDGRQAGLATTADAKGVFSLIGTFDDATRFRATKEGHASAIQTLDPVCASCSPENRWVSFSLHVLAPSISMAGDYVLTFVADSSCTMLPQEARTRTFTATIPVTSNATPANAYSNVVVGGANFFEDWNGLGFGVAGDYVAFWLETLVEQPAPNTFLAFGGLAAASVTSDASPITLRFSGSIQHCVTKSETGRYLECDQSQSATHAICNSENHRLILTRR